MRIVISGYTLYESIQKHIEKKLNADIGEELYESSTLSVEIDNPLNLHRYNQDYGDGLEVKNEYEVEGVFVKRRKKGQKKYQYIKMDDDCISKYHNIRPDDDIELWLEMY